MSKKVELELKEDKNKGDLDDDLDFNFDDIGGDLEGEMPKEKSRTPVGEVAHGAIDGASSMLKDRSFYTNTIKKVLPEGYGEAVDLTDKVATGTKKLLDDSVKQVKPAIAEFSKVAAKLMPGEKGKIKEGLGRITEWAEGYKSKADDKDAQREAGLLMNISEVFKFQMEQDVKERSDDNVKAKVNQGLEISRHKDIFGLLNNINLQTSSLNQYQTKITSAYQKKSLELQYRAYFVAQDSLEETKKFNEISKLSLADIVKNTSLPEAVKVTSHDSYKQVARNKFYTGVHDGLFGKNNNMIEKTFENIGNVLRSKIGEAVDGLRLGADMGNDIHDSNESMREYGGGGITVGGLGGSMAATSAIGKLTAKASKLAKEQLQKRPGLNAWFDRMSNVVNSVPQRLTEFREGNAGVDEDDVGQNPLKTFQNFILRSLKPFIPSMATDTTIEVDKTDDMHKPALYNKHASKSIIEIIPGYLARILREVSVFRTGNLNTDLIEYDFSKNKFDDKAKIENTIARKLFNRDRKNHDKEDIGNFVREIDDNLPPGKKMSNEQKDILHKHITEEQNKGNKATIESSIKYLRNSSGIGHKKLHETLTKGLGRNNDGEIESPNATEGSDEKRKQDRQKDISRRMASVSANAVKEHLERMTDYLQKETDITLTAEEKKALQLTFMSVNSAGKSLAGDRMGVASNYARTPGRDYSSKFADVFQKFFSVDETGKDKTITGDDLNTRNSRTKEWLRLSNSAGTQMKNILGEIQDLNNQGRLPESVKQLLYREGTTEIDKEKLFAQSISDLENIVATALPPNVGSSDVNIKNRLQTYNGTNALSSINKMPITSWNYKTDPKGAPPKVGPMAQDVQKVMGNEAAPDGKTVDLVSMNGATMAAVKELDKRQNSLDDKLETNPIVEAINTTNEKMDVLIEQIKNNSGLMISMSPGNAFSKGKNWAGKKLGQVTGLAKNTIKDTGWAIGSLYNGLKGKNVDDGDDIYDVRLMDEDGIRIREHQIRAGEIINDETKKVIKKVGDISTDLRDTKSDEIILKKSEIFRIVLKRTTKGPIRLIGKAMNLVGRTVRGIGSMGVATVRAFGKSLNAFTNDIYDLYVKGEQTPRITSFEFHAGFIVDEETKKVITRVGDITGATRNTKTDTIVLKREDIPNLVLRSTTKGAILGVSAVISRGFSGVRKILTNTGSFAKSALSGTLGMADEDVYDVFIKGEEDPRLAKFKIEAGVYILNESKKVITRVSEITESVYDTDKKCIVLLKEEIKDIILRSTTKGAIIGVRNKTAKGFNLVGRGVSKVFGFASDAIKSSGQSIFDSFSGQTDDVHDVYIKGRKDPVIYAYKLRDGKYQNTRTEEIIKTVFEITGPIKDLITNEIVVSEEDIPNLIFKNKSNKVINFGLNLSKKAFGLATDIVKTLPPIYRGALNVVKSIAGAFMDSFDEPMDIYSVTDLTKPILTAALMREFAYLSSKTREFITRPSQIDGPVLRRFPDTPGKPEEEVLSEEILKKGIVDVNGKPINSPWQKLKAATIGKISKGLKFIKNGIGGLFKGVGNVLGGLGSMIVPGRKERNFLRQIRDLLNTRLPGEQTVFNDKLDDDKTIVFDLKGKAKALKNKIVGAFGSLKDKLMGANNDPDSLLGKAKGFFSKAGDKFSNAKDNLKNRLSGANNNPNSLLYNAKGKLDNVKGKLSNVKNKVTKVGDEVADDIRTGIYDRNFVGPHHPYSEHGKNLSKKAQRKAERKEKVLAALAEKKEKAKTIKDNAKEKLTSYKDRLAAWSKGKADKAKAAIATRAGKKEESKGDGHINTFDYIQQKAAAAAAGVGSLASGAYDAFNNYRDAKGLLTKAPATVPGAPGVPHTPAVGRLGRMKNAVTSLGRFIPGMGKVAAGAGVAGLGAAALGAAAPAATPVAAAAPGLLSRGASAIGSIPGLITGGLVGGAKLAGSGAATLGGAALGGAGSLAGGAAKLGLKALGPLGLAYGGYSAYNNLKEGNYGSAALDVGLMGLSAGSLPLMMAALTNPVVLGALAVGAVGYGLYKGYKLLTKNKCGKLETLRYTQYGFKADDKQYWSKVSELEKMLVEKNVNYSSGVASFIDKGFDAKKAMGIFEVSEEDPEAFNSWLNWFRDRFKPVFLTYMTALTSLGRGVTLEDAEKLEPAKKSKFIKLVAFDNGPYDVKDSPVPDMKTLPGTREDIAKALEDVTKEVEDKKTDNKKESLFEKLGGAAIKHAMGYKTNAEEQAAEDKKADPTKKDNDIQGKKGALANFATPGKDSWFLTKLVMLAPRLVATQLDSALDGMGDALNIGKLTRLDLFRAVQYGFKEDQPEVIKLVFRLEGMLNKNVLVNDGKATIEEKNFNMENVLNLFAVSKRNLEAYNNLIAWYENRFKPIFLTHVGVLRSIDPKSTLAKVSSLSKEMKMRYLTQVKFDGGPYDVSNPPTGIIDKLVTGSAAVEKAYNQAAFEIKGDKSESTTFTVAPTGVGSTKSTDTGSGSDGTKEDSGAGKDKPVIKPTTPLLGDMTDTTKPVLIGAAAGLGAATVIGTLASEMVINATPSTTTGALSKLSMLRMLQYGFFAKQKEAISAILSLENFVIKSVKVVDGKAILEDNNLDFTNILSSFGVTKDNEKEYDDWVNWYIYRFKPIFLTHMTVLVNMDSKATLSNLDTLKPEQKLKYVFLTRFDEGPYKRTTSPFSFITSIIITRNDIIEAYEEVTAEVRSLTTKDKKGSEKSLFDINGKAKKTNAFLDDGAKPMELTKTQAVLKAIGGFFKDVVRGFTDPFSKAATSIMQVGKEIGKYFGFQVTPLETVRFKTYGLKTMDRSKVSALRTLENEVRKNLKYTNTCTASWTGNIEDLVKTAGPSFGIEGSASRKGQEWITWFLKRFLPTYLNFAGLIKQATNKDDPSVGEGTLKTKQACDIANKVQATDNVWKITESPWDGYVLTVDVADVKENILFLSQASEKDELIEAKGRTEGINRSRVATAITDKGKAASELNKPPPLVNPLAPKDGEAAPNSNGGSTTTNAKLTGSVGSLSLADGPLASGEGASAFMKLDSGVSLEGLNPAFRKNLNSLVEDYGKTTGKSLFVTSGYRSRAQQDALYRKDPSKAAPGGSSNHEFGLAIDASSAQLDEMDKLGLLRKYGFTRPVGGETWHLEASGTQVNVGGAKRDPIGAAELIKTGVGRGGGGYGSIKGSSKGRRNQEMAMSILKMPTQINTNVNKNDPAVTPPVLTPPDIPKDSVAAAPMPTPTKVAAPAETPSVKNTKGGYAGSTNNQIVTAPKPGDGKAADFKEAVPGSTGGMGKIPGVGPGGGMAAVKGTIEGAAKVVGVDPNLLMAVAGMESSFIPDNSNPKSPAKGLFQFMPDTWKEVLGKYKKKHEIPDDATPMDAKASSLLAAEYLKTTFNSIKRVKGTPNETDSYYGHMFGPTGAVKLLGADPNAIAANVLPDAVRQNPETFFVKGDPKAPRTIGQMYAYLTDKVKKKLASLGVTTLSKAVDTNASLNKNESVIPNQKSPSIQTANGPQAPTPPAYQSPSPTVAPVAPKSPFSALSKPFDSYMGNDSSNQAKQDSSFDMNSAMGGVDKTLKQSLDIQTQMLGVLEKMLNKITPGQTQNPMKNVKEETNNQENKPIDYSSKIPTKEDLVRNIAPISMSRYNV